MTRTAAALAGLLLAFTLLGAGWWVTAKGELDERAHRIRARAEELAWARTRLLGPGQTRAGAVVAADAERPRAEAERTIAGYERRFRSTAATFVAVALLVALLVAFVVQDAERAARQRSRFAAWAAHELRTPLAGLRLHAEMLADGLGDPAAREEHARRIASEATRLGRVVSNVLGFSRLERGRLRVRKAPGDLAAAVRACLEDLDETLAAADARAALSIPEPLPAVPFDRDALHEIVRNLVDNAERHTRGAADRTIQVLLAPHGPGVTLSVRDHGPGVPRRARRLLFRPFRRFGPPDGPAGLGLGLALARTLAREHGGELAYEDAEGGGARFRLFLPC